MRRCYRLLGFLILTSVPPVAAQSTVTGVRDLAFGVVIRGVQTAVSPADPIRSGRFYVRHVLNRRVRLTFTLPTQLARVGGGGNLPISFSNTDATWTATAPGSLPVTFNPNRRQTIRLGTSADIFVNLGGRVSPAAIQPTGAYTGTIILTVAFL
jgi:hypothetical protein